MNKSKYIHYNARYGWDLNDDAQRRQVTILSYGCDLDNGTIKKLFGNT